MGEGTKTVILVAQFPSILFISPITEMKLRYNGNCKGTI